EADRLAAQLEAGGGVAVFRPMHRHLSRRADQQTDPQRIAADLVDVAAHAGAASPRGLLHRLRQRDALDGAPAAQAVGKAGHAGGRFFEFGRRTPTVRPHAVDGAGQDDYSQTDQKREDVAHEEPSTIAACGFTATRYEAVSGEENPTPESAADTG